MHHLILASHCEETGRILLTNLVSETTPTLRYVQEYIGAPQLEVHTLSREVCIIVDSEAHQKPRTPVLEIQWKHCKGLHIPGNVIFAKRVLHNGEYLVCSFQSFEILDLLGDYALGPVGEIK